MHACTHTHITQHTQTHTDSHKPNLSSREGISSRCRRFHSIYRRCDRSYLRLCCCCSGSSLAIDRSTVTGVTAPFRREIHVPSLQSHACHPSPHPYNPVLAGFASLQLHLQHLSAHNNTHPRRFTSPFHNYKCFFIPLLLNANHHLSNSISNKSATSLFNYMFYFF